MFIAVGSSDLARTGIGFEREAKTSCHAAPASRRQKRLMAELFRVSKNPGIVEHNSQKRSLSIKIRQQAGEKHLPQRKV
jgi:hypothetical protein